MNEQEWARFLERIEPHTKRLEQVAAGGDVVIAVLGWGGELAVLPMSKPFREAYIGSCDPVTGEWLKPDHRPGVARILIVTHEQTTARATFTPGRGFSLE